MSLRKRLVIWYLGAIPLALVVVVLWKWLGWWSLGFYFLYQIITQPWAMEGKWWWDKELRNEWKEVLKRRRERKNGRV